MNTPDFTDYVIGYRAWQVGKIDFSWPPVYVLIPVSQSGTYWDPNDQAAKCMNTRAADHAVPDRRCQCGWYAYDTPNPVQSGYVIGAIVGWGKMQVHRNGFRCQYARVVALVEGDGVREVAATYRASVVRDVKALEAEAREWGSPLPDFVKPAVEGDEGPPFG